MNNIEQGEWKKKFYKTYKYSISIFHICKTCPNLYKFSHENNFTGVKHLKLDCDARYHK